MDLTNQIFGSGKEFFLIFWHSKFFLFVKVIIAVYVAVLFIDIILLFIVRGVKSDFRRMISGANIITASPGKIRKRWDKIRARLDSNSQSQFKAAILEADKLSDEILAGIGYQGSNLGERLKEAKPEHIDNLEDLIRAHEIRNKIIYEASYSIGRKEAEEILKIYEIFLKSVELL